MSTVHTFYQDLEIDVFNKLKNIKLAVFDVDGTISDGGIYLDREENELKKFQAKDGMGIALLGLSGVKAAIITGRNSPLTERRAKELKIPYIIQGKHDKEAALKELMNELNLTQDEVAVIGDDVNDLPLYENAAVSACPKDGYHYMQQIATINLTKEGGNGAAREFCDLILMAQGKVSLDGLPEFYAKKRYQQKDAAQ